MNFPKSTVSSAMMRLVVVAAALVWGAAVHAAMTEPDETPGPEPSPQEVSGDSDQGQGEEANNPETGESEKKGKDLSKWLSGKSGFLPVPIFITEPAVGYGLGFAPVFFHGSMEGQEADDGSGRKLPPSMTAAAAAYTTNGTWFVAGGHFGSWKQDTLRYTGALGYAKVNIDIYAQDNPLDFTIEGGFMMQEIKVRLGKSNFFLGSKWRLLDSTTRFNGSSNNSGEFPEVPADGLDSTLSGLGLVGYYDTRDNIFTPSKGQEYILDVLRYDEAIGSDFEYWYGKLKAISYFALHERFVLGLRLEGEIVSDGAPFYALPFVKLRGVPAMRYQDERVLTLEMEGRWRVHGKWSLVGFLGKGFTAGDDRQVETEDNIRTIGTGVRYLLADKINLHVGIDVARGPDTTAGYLTIGSAW